MFTTLIYKDANFHIYEINENGSIKKNGNLIDPTSIIHMTTTGRYYVMLETIHNGIVFYPLDSVIYNSFNKESMSNFRCIHCNGDLRDNNLENLVAIADEEEWRLITHPGVIGDTFYISSHGRIKGGHIQEPTIGNYCFRCGGDVLELSIYLDTHTNKGCYRKPYRMHRLVAYEFIGVIQPGEVINHIDADPMNNHLDNLEITSQEMNVSHSFLIHSNNSVITNDTWFAMENALIMFNGDMKLARKYLSENGISVTNKNINHAKYDYFKRRKYLNLGNYCNSLPTKDYRTTKDISVVEVICKTLVANNGSVNKTLKQLLAENYDITEYDIKNIKYKNTFSHISNEYFTFNNKEFVIL